MKSKLENYYPNFKVFSINNSINPTVDILIESIDRFSFGDESEDEKSGKKNNGEEKVKKTAPNNYSLIKTENLFDSNNLDEIINNIEEIISSNNKKNEEKNGKICGIFNKEDFEIKLDSNKKNHKNNQLNDSFEKNITILSKIFLI